MVWKHIFLSIFLAGILSGLGAFLLYMEEKRFEGILGYLISLSAGSIFGGVFIHLVFRLANGIGYTRLTGLLILAGVVGSFLLEKMVHWHCHHTDHDVEPFSYVLMAGDAVHNVLDGILIATGFLASFSSGLAATVAIMMHKIPKELGDFGVLVKGGFSRLKALLFNISMIFFMFIGAGIVFLLSNLVDNLVWYVLPLVIGNFVYIAGSDLLPEMKDAESYWLGHILVFCLGVAMMYLIPYLRNVATLIL